MLLAEAYWMSDRPDEARGELDRARDLLPEGTAPEVVRVVRDQLSRWKNRALSAGDVPTDFASGGAASIRRVWNRRVWYRRMDMQRRHLQLRGFCHLPRRDELLHRLPQRALPAGRGRRQLALRPAVRRGRARRRAMVGSGQLQICG